MQVSTRIDHGMVTIYFVSLLGCTHPEIFPKSKESIQDSRESVDMLKQREYIICSKKKFEHELCTYRTIDNLRTVQ